MSQADNAQQHSADLPGFRLKGGLFPMTLLELNHYQPEQLDLQLAEKVAEAPGFFNQVPTVLGLETFSDSSLDLSALQQICRRHGLLLSALRGGATEMKQQALELGIAQLPESKTRQKAQSVAEPVAEPVPEKSSEEDAPQKAEPQERPNVQAAAAHSPSKIITTPIRSGQQVYAAGGDLIVMAAVSAGAEVLADGNIHIYGALRGRALAGVQGDTSARIFCSSLEAELVSIAGHFQLDEELRGEHWKQARQIALNESSLMISALA